MKYSICMVIVSSSHSLERLSSNRICMTKEARERKQQKEGQKRSETRGEHFAHYQCKCFVIIEIGPFPCSIFFISVFVSFVSFCLLFQLISYIIYCLIVLHRCDVIILYLFFINSAFDVIGNDCILGQMVRILSSHSEQVCRIITSMFMHFPKYFSASSVCNYLSCLH